MEGHATAPAAGTVLNALAIGTGSAFALDLETRAAVELDDSGEVTGEIAGAPGADTALVERCVSLTTAAYGDGEGGRVRTEGEVPMAAGLKSSSAAANAAVLATLDAIGMEVADDRGEGAGGTGADRDGTVPRLEACRLGVAAAREVGVTVTGAFDDASASMLGGVTVTDNAADELLARAEREWAAVAWTPPERAYAADADVSRCERVAGVAELVAELALDGRFAEAMTVNGFAFSAALGFPTAPAVEALPEAAGVSLSGTGPSVVAVGASHAALDPVADRWTDRPGRVRRIDARTEGARIA